MWRDAVTEGSAPTGAEVRVAEARGKPMWRGIFEPGSPLAIRIWAHGDVPLDEGLVRGRVERALALRKRLFSPDRTNAYRLLHGEGDRTPGFVIDRYANVAVVRLDGPAAEAFFARRASAVCEPLRELGIETVVRRSRDKTAPKGVEVLSGPSPPDTIHVMEHGVPFVVDLARGQKTGTFLDQRENRRRVAELAAGRSMLNLFSHAGGFSLHAALRGAEVTSVDIAAGAHATAQASFRLAGVEPKKHAFVTADAFAYLAEAKRKGRRWDVVVSDPPSFAPSEKSVPRALQAYRALHRACADVLAPGGIFCAASCSSHVDAAAFTSTLDDAVLGRNDLRLLELHGPPADHPGLPAFPEGLYLKLAILA